MNIEKYKGKTFLATLVHNLQEKDMFLMTEEPNLKLQS